MRARQWRQGVLIGILLLIGAWLTVSIFGLAQKTVVAVSEANEARARYEAIEKRKSALLASLALLETERGRDAAIRTAFGVAKEGEEVVVVVTPEPVATTTEPLSWWQVIGEWFK